MRVGLGQVGLEVGAQREEGQVHGARRVAPDHAEVAVLLHLEWGGIVVLDPPTDGVQATDARIAEPAEDELAGHAGADHLVVDDVRRHARQRQVALPLADDLVAGREADEVREALDGHGVAVADQVRDRVAHGGDLAWGAHRSMMPEPCGGCGLRDRPARRAVG